MNILIIGDSCKDIFVKGKVERLCPEAPVPVINPFDVQINVGMAGNVYANIRSLSPNSNVVFYTQGNSIFKTRYVDSVSGYILLRVDEGDKADSCDVKKLLDEVDASELKFDIVVISDYNKGYLSEHDIYTLVTHFSDALTFVDTKKQFSHWTPHVTFVKINEKEYNAQLDKSPQNVIVTLGGKGSKYIAYNLLVPSEKVEVMDVSGAGDTYLAAFATKYAQIRDVKDAMIYANKASAVAASKHGVVAVQQSEVN